MVQQQRDEWTSMARSTPLWPNYRSCTVRQSLSATSKISITARSNRPLALRTAPCAASLAGPWDSCGKSSNRRWPPSDNLMATIHEQLDELLAADLHGEL